VTRSAVNLVQAELRPPAVRLVFVVSDLALLAWHCERSQVVIAHNAGAGLPRRVSLVTSGSPRARHGVRGRDRERAGEGPGPGGSAGAGGCQVVVGLRGRRAHCLRDILAGQVGRCQLVGDVELCLVHAWGDRPVDDVPPCFGLEGRHV
jgi:hypothetical protein